MECLITNFLTNLYNKQKRKEKRRHSLFEKYNREVPHIVYPKPL
jgi:hypothetical protein